jgi:intracellular sulfur oxidation DsrE/DsrF family protein
MINIKLTTNFSVHENNGIFILNMKILNALGTISVSYQRNNNGDYHLISENMSKKGIWEPRYAGLAVIYNFLDDQIRDDSKITIITNIKNESTKEENEIEVIEDLKNQNIQINFSNLASKDVPEELAKGALKFYLIEKTLKETSVEDIEQIGYNKIIPRGVEIKYIQKRRKVFDDKKGKDVIRVAGFDFDCLIY